MPSVRVPEAPAMTAHTHTLLHIQRIFISQFCCWFCCPNWFWSLNGKTELHEKLTRAPFSHICYLIMMIIHSHFILRPCLLNIAPRFRILTERKVEARQLCEMSMQICSYVQYMHICLGGMNWCRDTFVQTETVWTWDERIIMHLFWKYTRMKGQRRETGWK